VADNDWMEMYHRLVAYKYKYKTTVVPKKLKEDRQLGKWVYTQRRDCKEKDRVDLLNDVGFVWSLKDLENIDWKVMYDRLVAYKKKHNSVCVPYYWTEDPELAKWFYKQLMGCKDKCRVDLLNDIGFDEDFRDEKDNCWMEMYQRLVEYQKNYKQILVVQHWIKEPQLFGWINRQRKDCKKKDRVDLLNDIGIVWDLKDVDDTAWRVMYDRLVAYKKNHNSVCVPLGWTEDPKLANWVCKQRKSCKEKYRIDLLAKIGFVRNAQDQNWMQMFQRLVEYKKKHMTTDVPRNWKQDPRLAKWAQKQRKGCKEKDQVNLLNDIDFHWISCKFTVDAIWMKMYHRLVAYKYKYKTTVVPRKWMEDPKLSKWVNKQRNDCKEKDRVDLLNDIGFAWDCGTDAADTDWMEMYNRLVAYKRKHKITCITRDSAEDPKLGNWVHYQRQVCKEKSRVDLLDDIGFVWDSRDVVETELSF